MHAFNLLVVDPCKNAKKSSDIYEFASPVYMSGPPLSCVRYFMLSSLLSIYDTLRPWYKLESRWHTYCWGPKTQHQPG